MGKSIPSDEHRESLPGIRNRKLYVARLRDEGLPVGRVARTVAAPQQFQVAQLAAVIGIGTAKQSPTELAARAVQLWNATGKVLVVQEQLAVVCRGLLHFDRDDWWTHAGELVRTLDDGAHAVPGTLDLDTTEEFVEAGRRAGSAVEEAWERSGPFLANDAVLRALFPGRAETERTRSEKFLKLAQYIRSLLARESVEKRDYFRKYRTDALTSWIEGTWTPLGFVSAEQREHVLRLTRERVETPSKFLKPCCLIAFASVARWLVVMRQKQAAEARARS